MDKPARSRRYVVGASAARIIAGLSVLRDQVIVPILAGLRRGARADQQTSVPDRIDGHYVALRTGMQALLLDSASPRRTTWPHEQLFVDVERPSA